jgi:hypothetical protein
MSKNTLRTRIAATALAVVAIGCASAVVGQTISPATEGYDPFRQITTQILSSNLMIVLDQSGSLTFPMSFDNTYPGWASGTAYDPGEIVN